MASINKLASKGKRRWLAQVNVKTFDRVSKRFETEQGAHAWANALERELIRQRDGGGLRQDLAKLTLADLVTERLKDPDVKRQASYDDTERQLLWWSNACGQEKLLSFNVIKVRAARDRLAPGRSPGTQNRYMAAMRSCWNWGRGAGLVPDDKPWPTKVMRREPKHRVRFLDDGELVSVMKAAAQHEPVVKAAILVAIAVGVRKSELWRLTWRDIDFDASTIRVLLAKNGEARPVFLPASAASALKDLRRSTVIASIDQTVFMTRGGMALDQQYIERAWRKIRPAADLKNFRWHDLRHTTASVLAQAGASLLEIGQVLGHKSPQSTWRYAHLVAGSKVKGHDELDAKLADLSS